MSSDFLLFIFCQVRPLPGAVELIERLWVLGIPLAIATSSSQKVVALKRAACPEIFEKVSVIVCGDDPDVLHGKPKPDIFLVAGKSLSWCHLYKEWLISSTFAHFMQPRG